MVDELSIFFKVEIDLHVLVIAYIQHIHIGWWGRRLSTDHGAELDQAYSVENIC